MLFAAPPPMPVEEVSGDKLKELVRYNCWGIEYADLGVAPLRRQQSHSYIGEDMQEHEAVVMRPIVFGQLLPSLLHHRRLFSRSETRT